MSEPVDAAADAPEGHDLVAHLYVAALQLMDLHQQVFLPLDVVRERLGWPPELLGRVVDHCVRTTPVVAGGFVADWMEDGEQPAFGKSRMRFIGIREAERMS